MLQSILLVAALISSSAQAKLCEEWSAPTKVGTLDTKLINEASGLAISRQFPNRAYHINDSGDDAYFYATDLEGAHTQKVRFSVSFPRDVEDIALGSCASGSCLFVADIGDNFNKRLFLTVWKFPELANYSTTITAKKNILVYPDGAHDAESLAIHPVTGDLFVLTKAADWVAETAAPAKLFRARRAALEKSTRVELELVGEIDLPFLLPQFAFDGQIATSMDFSPDASRLMILTYYNALEVNLESLRGPIQSREWKSGVDYRFISWTPNTSQQEAVAYAADGKSFYYTSEFNPKNGDQDAPLFQVSCTK